MRAAVATRLQSERYVSSVWQPRGLPLYVSTTQITAAAGTCPISWKTKERHIWKCRSEGKTAACDPLLQRYIRRWRVEVPGFFEN